MRGIKGIRRRVHKSWFIREHTPKRLHTAVARTVLLIVTDHDVTILTLRMRAPQTLPNKEPRWAGPQNHYQIWHRVGLTPQIGTRGEISRRHSSLLICQAHSTEYFGEIQDSSNVFAEVQKTIELP